ncbi:hypothetical protein FBT96_12410 [Rhodobacter capsulatus]|uniref:Helix-turn-helix domain-containing protein n=1 Tax=Rhodobacter capsulatus TaxID=1061 RepID=A0A4U1JPN6_RHOCA|nr:helix-turn-helix domain-containing protein [Rhodobacter capsulatus]TKD17940.1 hypothetical protein FBT96_12410 [Rhodobacter capsulatus]
MMRTTFAAAIAICGLSQQEAADYLGVRIDTVKSWSSGRNPPPDGVWGMLADLYRRVENAADHASSQIEPDLMDKRAMNNLQADSGEDPLPGGAAAVAGAMALLLAIGDIE